MINAPKFKLVILEIVSLFFLVTRSHTLLKTLKKSLYKIQTENNTYIEKYD